jgi:pantoate--beta-alanine ligase
MQIIKNVNQLIEYRKNINNEVSFVPTMGALHEGHLSLMKSAKTLNNILIVSIFVNPTQFLAGEDLEKYPNQISDDIRLCKEYGVDILFLPNKDSIYFNHELGIKAFEQKAYILEGFRRPGHFDGVLQVVLKLFNIVKPNYAFFGKKDAQQLYMISKMVETLFLDIKVIACDTVRQSDGLALSSRNVYLSSQQRLDALKISKSLFLAQNMVLNENCLTISKIENSMKRVLSNLDVEYIAFVNRDFENIKVIEKSNSIILIAVKIDNTRLIDNIWI